MDNSNDLRLGRKHVSRACLECRKRHYKCTGELPVCAKCVKAGRVCVYVESHRGGARKKGVSTTKTKSPGEIPDIEDYLPPQEHAQFKESNVRISNQQVYDQIQALPCSKDHSRCADSSCPGKAAANHFIGRKTFDDSDTAVLDLVRKKMKLDNSLGHLDCLFADKKNEDDHIDTLHTDLSISLYSALNFLDPITFNKQEIIKNYYERFHRAHPFFPQKEDLDMYLTDPMVETEVLLIMKIVGDGQKNNLYSKDISLISDRLYQCIQLIKDHNHYDVMTLQVLLLVSLIGHISAIHSFGRKIRHFCIHLIKELEINTIDAKQPTKLLSSLRLKDVPSQALIDNTRRSYWELYFFEVIMGSADGRSITRLAEIPSTVNYPTYPPREIFDYKGRSESAKLVIEAVKMNVYILNKNPIESVKKKLRAAIATREIELEDPDMFGAPSLIHTNGQVNEGVHQATLLFNYAKVFAFRPFSYLWKINAPQNPNCGDTPMEAKDLPTHFKTEALAIIDTRKTIEAANSIVEALINTGSTKVVERTPMFACALALSSLVHLNSYIWAENALDQKQSGFSHSDLDCFSEYIKLALLAIYPISNHWILSGKLAKHIRDSLNVLKPNLYSKMKDLLPQVEVKIENISHSESLSTQPDLGDSSATSETSEPLSYSEGLLHDDNHVLKGNDLIDDVPGLDFKSDFSPLSDSGCDWIDKALLDFFEGENLNIIN